MYHVFGKHIQTLIVPLLLASSGVLSLTGGFTGMTALRLMVENMRLSYAEATFWLAGMRLVDALWAVVVSPVFDKVPLLPVALGASIVGAILRVGLALIVVWPLGSIQDWILLPLLMVITSMDGVVGRTLALQLKKTADSTQPFAPKGETALATKLFSYDYAVGNLGAFLAGIVFDLARTYSPSHGTANAVMQLLGSAAAVLLALLVFTAYNMTQFGRHVEEVNVSPHDDLLLPPSPSCWQEVRALLADRTLWRFTAFSLCLMGARSVMVHLETTLTEVMMRLFGSRVHFSAVQSINPLLVIFGAPVLQHWLARFNGYWVITVGAAISGASVLPLVVAPASSRNAWTIYSPYALFVALFSVGECTWSARLSAYSLSVTPAGKQASYLALVALPLIAVRFVAGWHSGWMVETYCPPHACNAQALWGWIMGFGLLTPVLLVVGRRWLDANRQQVDRNYVLKR